MCVHAHMCVYVCVCASVSEGERMYFIYMYAVTYVVYSNVTLNHAVK